MLLLAVLIGLLLAGVLLAGPPVADDTLALRRFLSESGIDVHRSATPPTPPGTFVLLKDLRDRKQAATLLRWVESGGRLIVTDPQSPLLELLHVGVADQIGLFGISSAAPQCPAPETVGVREVVVAGDDVTLRPSAPEAVACFVRPEGSYVAFLERGTGRITVVGGNSPFTNDLLDHGDNAIFALQVFSSGGPVVFGAAAPPGARSPGLWSLLPESARVVLFEIAVAAVLFALASARRLGKPVTEDLVAPIPASELVRATAGLYRGARAAGFCGRLLRRSAAERLSGRVGAPADPSGSRLTDLVAASSSLPRDRVERALAGPQPESDDELLALADELSAIIGEIEGAKR